jgi:dTDP-4-dehydrorhamnose reductase
MRIAITGSQGQLGAELCRQLGAEVSAGWTQAGSDIASEPGRTAPVVGLDLPEFDLTDRDRVVSTMMEIRP